MSQTDVATLNTNFGIPGQLAFRADANELVTARISNAHASAEIALQGAHVMSYQSAHDAPLLWMSRAARLTPGKSLRGGIPVCWPWFGAHATEAAFPAHGFARTVLWQAVESRALPDGATRLTLELPQSAMPPAQWNHSCRLQLKVTVGPALDIDLVTENTGDAPFTITEALHTYFAISDIGDVSITGMEDCDYLDKVAGFERRTQRGAIWILSEVDRVYLDVERDTLIEDPGLNRRIRIKKQGSLSNVVWNPWMEKSAKMGDMGDEGYRAMVCVESANAASNAVTLPAGSVHTLHVTYSTEEI
jgi:glucose-6-phosphate 1-epimerase